MIKLFESFTEIKDICRRYNIFDYAINSDESIDVDNSVDLSNKNLYALPLKFNRVTGDFICTDNQLNDSLEDAPHEIGGHFSCSWNKLTSLEGAPQKVNGTFACYSNQLTSLEGAPQKINGNFFCSRNRLTSLQGAPQEIGGEFACNENQLTSLQGAPRRVGGHFNCRYNKIWTFDGAPDYIRGNFICDGNPIYEIWKLFEDYDKIEFFNECDPIREVNGKPAIILERLNGFLEDIGEDPVSVVNRYINI